MATITKSCVTCSVWDTFCIPNCCDRTVKAFNPTGYLNEKYYVGNPFVDCCDEWHLGISMDLKHMYDK